jgi:uncharacterized membrane protein YeaQ/YmgE (transglycosylase-associated protein family)
MGIVGWLIVGALVGLVVRTLRRRHPGDGRFAGPIAIVGAVIGGLVGDSIEVGHVESSFDLASFTAAAAGALVMLVAYRGGGGRR